VRGAWTPAKGDTNESKARANYRWGNNPSQTCLRATFMSGSNPN